MSSVKRIMIIDNDPIVNLICLHLIKRVLPEVHVISFVCPEEGLLYLQTEYIANPDPAILLLDINMPALTGWEVLDELEPMRKELQNHLSIFMFSSSINYEDKELCKAYSLVEDFVEKPLTEAKLKAITSLVKAVA